MRKIYSLLFILVVTLFTTYQSFAANAKILNVKVGYVLQDGLVQKDENGNLYGYTIDYLREMEKYSYIKFEFIESNGNSTDEKINNSYKMLDNGEIDLLGATLYLETLAKKYLYLEKPYGKTSSIITCLDSSDKFHRNEPQLLDGIVLGYYAGFSVRYAQFESYAKAYGISFSIKEYDTIDQVYEACEKGEVDATFGNDLSIPKGYKILTKFDPRDFFFISQLNNLEKVVPLNNAMSTLESINPNFQNELYEKYFYSTCSFSLTENDSKYLNELPTIKIGLFNDIRPLSYFEDNEWKGLLVDYLKMLIQNINIKFEVIMINNLEDLYSKIDNQEIDIVFGLPSYIELESRFNYHMSRPIYSEYGTIISHNSKDKELRYSLTIESDIKSKTFNNTMILMPSSCANLYLKQHKIYNQYDIDYDYYSDISFVAVDFSHNNQLVNIIDRYFSSSINHLDINTYYTEFNYTFIDYIIIFWVEILFSILVLAIIISIGVFILVKFKIKNLRQQNMINIRYKFILDMMKDFIFSYDYKTDIFKYRYNKLHKGESFVIKNFVTSNKFKSLNEIIQKQNDIIDKKMFNIGDGNKWYCITTSCCYDKNGNIESILGALSDIDLEVKKHDQLTYQANYDMLTNILNRRGLKDAIPTKFANNKNGYCLIMDLDNFKQVNDKFGHQMGDNLLKRFSKLLKESFETELTARFAGDEFIVISNENLDEEKLKIKLDLFYKQAYEKIFKEFSMVQASVSIGAYIFNNIEELDIIYNKTDKLLYDAKVAKNNYSIDKE